MESADEGDDMPDMPPPPPGAILPASRRTHQHAHAPPSANDKARIGSNTPLPHTAVARNGPAATSPAVTPKKATQNTNPGNDFFGFGSSLTVKGEASEFTSP